MGKKKIVGRQIRKARKQVGMSQLNLSLELGLSDKAISSYEAGRTTPTLETVEKMSEILHKPITYFLDKEGDDFDVPTRIALLEDKIVDLLSELKDIKKLVRHSRSRRKA